MVFLALNGLRFPGPNGVERTAKKGDILYYLPLKSIAWMIEQGEVKPLCTSSLSHEDCDCRWCRLAALTKEDQAWLEFYGWENPFSE